MALNLWKIGGKPTSYNPLPTGWGNTIDLPLGSYVVTFKAKSANSGQLFLTDQGSYWSTTLNLTPNFQSFSINLNVVATRIYDFCFNDKNSVGDIIIQDIQLVQKSLPKLTINGIDGFNSGKWTLHPNARVIDDETLELNSTGIDQKSIFTTAVLPNTPYTIFVENGSYALFTRNGITDVVNHGWRTGSFTFTTGSNVNNINLWLSNVTTFPGKFTFKKPMLNLGTTPAPYSKKTGEKMVLPTVKGNLFNKATVTSGFYVSHTTGGLVSFAGSGASDFIPVNPLTDYFSNKIIGGADNSPFAWYDINKTFISGGMKISTGVSVKAPSNAKYLRFTVFNADLDTQMLTEGTTAQPYTPYAVQVNKKPKRYVPKKNLFDGQYDNGYISDTSETLKNATVGQRTTKWVACKPNTTYILSGGDRNGWQLKNSAGVITLSSASNMITTLSDTMYLRVYYSTNGTHTNIQLEEGTTATPYEPYTQVLPRAKNGLSFNGTSDYLQLPSMTMDSIEIECLIDSVQKSNGSWKYVVDARNGLANSWYALGSDNTNWQTGSAWTRTGALVKGERSKVNLKASSPFTANVRIFGDVGGLETVKGTLYKVTCYLAGQVVATYDFENPSNIVGDKVLPNAKNLIPSFEDSRWSLHANADVLGKDVLRLEASGTFQVSVITLDVLPSTSYRMVWDGNGSVPIDSLDINGVSTNISPFTNKSVVTFTTRSDTKKIKVNLTNANVTTGTFDFIKPQLYELTGKEGTLNGKPTPLRKAAKRKLYSKR